MTINSETRTKDNGHERAIANLLRRGTTLASLIIGMGLLAQWLHPAQSALLNQMGFDLMRDGVALLILLPIFRLLLMLAHFLRARDKAYATIAALVLAIITAGFVSGL